MSREAIESFVDEIRDELPRMRRAFAIMHAWPDDHDALREAHRLTHSIKGTAALVGVHSLSEIAERQETLLEQLLDGRLAMNDGLRDTLERMADLIESSADNLLKGSIPEQRLLAEADALGAGLPTPPDRTTEGLPSDFAAAATNDAETCGPEDGGIGRPAPSAPVAHVDSFRDEALSALRVIAEKLDTYRRDLTRWDLLADVHCRVHSLQMAADADGLQDVAALAQSSERLLQRVLDRTVPSSENAADCLQACVDALEQRLDQNLDEAILQQLHERLDELCNVRSTELADPEDDQPASNSAEAVVEPPMPRPAVATDVTAAVVIHTPTSPQSIELDDRSELSEEMLEVFTEEAEDHLRQIYSAFTELEADPARMSSIQEVRRSAHTIKGAAGSVGLRLVSKLSHRMEDLLDVLFSSQQPITGSTLALLYDTTDALQDLVHGSFAPEGMQVTVAQLYDSYDVALRRSGVSDQRSEESVSEPLSQPTELIVEVRKGEVPAEPDSLDTTSSPEVERSPVVDIATSEVAATPNELVVQEFLPMLAAWNQLSEPDKALPAQKPETVAQRSGSKKHAESLRVPLARIDSLMQEVSELIINRSSFEQRMSDFGRCLEELQRAVERMRTVSHDLDTKYGVGALGGRQRLWGDGASLLPGGWRSAGQSNDEFDALELDRYTEFHLLSRSLAETTTDIGTVGQELRNLLGDFDQLLNRQGRLSRDTQDRLMRIRLLPLTTLADKLQRTVRVVAGQQHKDVELLIQGGETEIDKVVLEELADPLMHLLRNAVDHGLEDAATRQAAGKPERATICIQAFQQGTQVVIRVNDDGQGLNFDAIRDTAVRHGLVTASEASNRSRDELSAFIFLPGFSTANEVTEVSGRGVGMDIVRDKVQKLKGTIAVESHEGQGTTFTIRLPMTLAVTRALLLHVGTETFAMPMQSVVQILRLERHEIDLLGPSPMIRLGDETLPFVYLAEKLGLRQSVDKTSATMPVLVLAAGDQKVAIAVDKILPGRDIVVKSLGTHLRKVRGLIGATLMGDGSVVPILDETDLVMPMTRPMSAVPAPHQLVRRDESPTIMIVDDSVSVRRVMSNLLKHAGWSVLEAKDGLDAIAKLQTTDRSPDLFLLDIEMPRMDGYELLTSLRSRAEHFDTPVVMVTSRAGDKHRKKAMRLGATDYVVKPYQDQELLSLIRRLLAVSHEEVLA